MLDYEQAVVGGECSSPLIQELVVSIRQKCLKVAVLCEGIELQFPDTQRSELLREIAIRRRNDAQTLLWVEYSVARDQRAAGRFRSKLNPQPAALAFDLTNLRAASHELLEAYIHLLALPLVAKDFHLVPVLFADALLDDERLTARRVTPK